MIAVIVGFFAITYYVSIRGYAEVIEAPFGKADTTEEHEVTPGPSYDKVASWFDAE